MLNNKTIPGRGFFVTREYGNPQSGTTRALIGMNVLKEVPGISEYLTGLGSIARETMEEG